MLSLLLIFYPVFLKFIFLLLYAEIVLSIPPQEAHLYALRHSSVAGKLCLTLGLNSGWMEI